MELRRDITDRAARSRTGNLFVSYKSLLQQNGLTGLTNENGKAAFYHVSSVIRPERLGLRRESDLELPHYDLRKELRD